MESKKIKRNQLAELIAEDGQPMRALFNYLSETMEYLEGIDCITDYYTTSDADHLIESHPVAMGRYLKMDNQIFLDSLLSVYGNLKKEYSKPIDINEMYLELDHIFDEDDEDFVIERDNPFHCYCLNANRDRPRESRFLIRSDNYEFVGNIEILVIGLSDSDKTLCGKKLKEINSMEKLIYFSAINDDHTSIEYKEDVNVSIVPLNKIPLRL